MKTEPGRADTRHGRRQGPDEISGHMLVSAWEEPACLMPIWSPTCTLTRIMPS